MGLPHGFGLMLTTERDRVDLGDHYGRRLRGRTEQRLLRVAFGERGGLRLTLSRSRAVAVEVTEQGRRYELPIPAPADPWPRAAGRLLLVSALASMLVAMTWDGSAKERHGSA